MTVSLFVFVPVALLVLIGAFCFVGCTLNSGPYPDTQPVPFTTYSDSDVIANRSCVAYWPLNDGFLAEDPAKRIAHDVVGAAIGSPHDGTFVNIDTQPALFPCPAVELNPTSHSAPAPGTLASGALGIVKGDAMQPLNNPNVLRPCIRVDGAFVTVPVNATINPPGPFTIELWAQPGWSAGDSPATRTVIEARDAAGGFAIRVNDAGNWEGVVVVSGTAAIFAAAPVTLAAPNHVVLTYDGTNAALFTDGALTSQMTPAAGFAPNTASPLVIGVGGANLPPRTQPTDLVFFPLVPFKGKLQNVAIYNAALSAAIIKTYFEHGMGNSTEEPNPG